MTSTERLMLAVLGLVVAALGGFSILYLTTTYISDHTLRLIVDFVSGWCLGGFLARIFFIPALFGDY